MGKKADGTDETKELTGEGIPQETQKADDAAQEVKPEEEPVSAPEADAPKAEEGPDADQSEQAKTEESADAENSDEEADQDKQGAEVKTTEEPAKSDYTVHGCNIRHNGMTYKEGTKISLTAEEAHVLKQYVRA